MPTRRELLQGAAAGLAATILDAAEAQELGPFDNATARFDKANQERLPPWAFRDKLKRPPVLRPRKVAAFKDLIGQAPFAPEDPIRLGDVFHGIAREWWETPEAWRAIGCDPSQTGDAAWCDKRDHFGSVPHYRDLPDPMDQKAPAAPTSVHNWGHFPVKCYKMPLVEEEKVLRPESGFPARVYTYAHELPGPTLKLRHGQPAVVRFENHLETEASIHLHGAHTPAHSDGFPTFYVLPEKARDYFYPNILPLETKGDAVVPALGEAQSTMWYHDHGMDVTAFNVSKGLAGFALFYSDWELNLLRRHILPGLGEASCVDPDEQGLAAGVEDPEKPGFYKHELGKEPFFNPYDVPLVLQDKVIDRNTGQISYDSDAHNGYLGDTFFVNGRAWPYLEIPNRKHRLRILNGSNARVYRLRLLSEDDFLRSQQAGISSDELDGTGNGEDGKAKPFLQIGKDSWLWSSPQCRKSVVVAMANRVDLVVDFKKLAGDVGKTPKVFYLVNTMPQFDGRGPKPKLEDGGDPRVLPLPFDEPGEDPPTREGDPTVPNHCKPPIKRHLVELDKPIALLKIIVRAQTEEEAKVKEASVAVGSALMPHREPIPDKDVRAVREFIFERGKGAWQVNGRFYDPTLANAAPNLDMTGTMAEEWVLRNGGGGWWHPIHIHLESHQIVSYEKDFDADRVIDPVDEPPKRRLPRLVDVTKLLPLRESAGNHDTQILGPNTVVRIRMRFRTWPGPFVFHCHNLEHEDMRMMFNFEPVPGAGHDPNVAPAARTHGNAVTLDGRSGGNPDGRVGELEWEYPPVPLTPDAGEDLIKPRKK